jgi:putative transposase
LKKVVEDEKTIWFKRLKLCGDFESQLLVADDKSRGVIADSIKLIAGRTGQEFNQRKARKGAFWEDRYHATAIEDGDHLKKCIVYIDLNMVRAGVVKHPSEWPYSGYNEIQQPKM